MHEAIQTFLKTHAGQGFTGNRFLCAVSGGVDSMVLLHAMHKLLGPQNLAVGHYHHARRAEADADAQAVQAMADALGIPVSVEKRDSSAPGDEAALRADRHAFLERARAQHFCDWIVTAHHADDQLETVLMRLVRGTGLDGLKGIPPVRGAWLRPLLGHPKQELIAYAQAHRIFFREDASNADIAYFRNRVRAHAVPVLSELAQIHGGRPALLRRVSELVEEIRESEKVIESQTRAALAHLGVMTAFWLRMERHALEKLPAFWRYRLLRLALRDLNAATLDRPSLQRLDKMIAQQVPSASLPGVRLMQSCGYIYLQTPVQSALASAPRVISQEGPRVYLEDLEMAFTAPPQGWEVRFFQPGDTWRGKKLKEVFLSRRIPQPERRLIPLLAQRGSKEIECVFPQHHAGLRLEQGTFPYASPVRSLGFESAP